MSRSVSDPTPRPPSLPDEFWTREQAYVARRRIPNVEPAHAPPPRHLVGLALSGGGIRSATVSLGVLQALARRGRLRFIDYVSTVSGGGYIGTFLGGLFQRWSPSSGDDTVASDSPRWSEIEAVLKEPRSPPVEWLRESGRYLAPSGSSDMWLSLGVVLRNLVAIHVVLSTLIMAAFLIGNGIRRSLTASIEHYAGAKASILQDLLVGHSFWWSPSIVPAFALATLWALPCGIAYWLVRTDEHDGRSDGTDRISPLLALTFLIVAAVACFISARVGLALYRGPWAPPLLAALLFLLAGAFWARAVTATSSASAARNRLTLTLRSALLATAGFSAFAVLDSTGQTLYAIWAGGDGLRSVLAWIGVGFSGTAGIAMFMQRVAGQVGQGTAKTLKVPAQLLAMVVALSLVLVMLVGLAAAAHGLTWKWSETRGYTSFSAAATDRYDIVLPDGTHATVRDPVRAQPICRTKGGLGGADEHLCTPRYLNLRLYLWALGVTLLLSLAFGQTYSFVNRSSLSALYGARLSRAYLGASNPMRDDPTRQNLTVQVPGDELPLREYRPHEKGGPLHIINVTLNETIDGRSNVEQKDRKGMGLALSPAGISVGVQHHAVWEGDNLRATDDPASGDRARFRVFPEKALFSPRSPSVGQWMAISGAAVSTGLGSRTSTGLSLLIGLFNFRLGYWWRSGVDPDLRTQASERKATGKLGPGRLFSRMFPVQSHLMAELLARFPGTAREDWYLSDGGHFENTGAYELVRRRLPLIILCDNGADDGGQLGDLGNFVRKVRTDFAAEVCFFDRAAIDDLDQSIGQVLGTIEDLGLPNPCPPASDVDKLCRRYATLAWIKYSDGAPPSLLLVLHPTVNGSEPIDVRSYQRANPTFPQQSTGDQFFDDAQWEAYRRLGEHMGEQVLAAISPELNATDPGEGWWPSRLPRTP